MESNSDITFYHIFTRNTNTDSNLLKYEYKTDVSNSETRTDIYSIWEDNISLFSLLIIYNYKIMWRLKYQCIT
jgi:hypothetical protein